MTTYSNGETRMWRSESTTSLTYPQDPCGPTVTSLPMKTGGPRRIYQCDECHYRTDRRNNLKRHKTTMHEACDQALECCGRRFPSKASLRAHTHLFHRNGYYCSECDRMFCRKALLKRHYSVHSGYKEFVCADCGYATSHKSNLQRHRKIHNRNAQERASSGSHPSSPSSSSEGMPSCSLVMTPQLQPSPFEILPSQPAVSFAELFREYLTSSDKCETLPPTEHSAVPLNVEELRVPSISMPKMTDNVPHITSPISIEESPEKKDDPPHNNICFDSENRQRLFRQNGKVKAWLLAYTCENEALKKRPTPSRRVFRFPRMRLCDCPYKCHECNETFGNQRDLAKHHVERHPERDPLAMSDLVTTIHRMEKICLKENALQLT